MRTLTLWLMALAATFTGLPAHGADEAAPVIVSIDARSQPDAPPRFQSLNRVALLGDGTVAVAGRMNDRAYLIILNGRNEVLSAAEFAHITIEHMAASADPGFLIAGTMNVSSRSPVTGVGSGNWPVMIRVDRGGAIATATILTHTAPTTLVGIAETPDGGILVTGNVVRPRIQSYKDRAENRRFDPVIVKLTRAGAVAWATSLLEDDSGDTSGIAANGAAITREGRLFISGANALVHLDSGGDMLWALRFGMPGDTNMSARGVANFGDDAVLGGRVSRPGRAGLDAWAMSIRKDGVLRWAEFIDAGPSDRIESIAGTDAGTFLLAGITRRMGASLEDVVEREDGWLVDINDAGRVRRSMAVGGNGDDHLSAAAAMANETASVGTAMIGATRANILVRVGPAPMEATSARSCQLASPIPATVLPAPIMVSPVECAVGAWLSKAGRFNPR